MISSIKRWFGKIEADDGDAETLREDVLGVEESLEDVEESLESIRSWDAPQASEIAHYMVEAGGKRLRPTLVFMTYKAAGGAEPEEARPYAVAAELLHTATLLHDDVIDESETRRGQPAAKVKYGNRRAILAGDFLVATIVEDLLERDYPEVARYLGFTMRRLVEGEFLQEEYAERFDLDEEQYFQVVELKTAALFAYSAWAGSYLPQQDKELSNQFARYAESLGVAFQIVDDVLDFESRQTGKDALNDLEKGNINYPLILLLRDRSDLRRQLREEYNPGDELSDQMKESILDPLYESDILEKSRQEAKKYSNKARAALESVPDTPQRDLLNDIPRFVTERLQ
jgi:octaprenyl-diphosphate synthase